MGGNPARKKKPGIKHASDFSDADFFENLLDGSFWYASANFLDSGFFDEFFHAAFYENFFGYFFGADLFSPLPDWVVVVGGL